MLLVNEPSSLINAQKNCNLYNKTGNMISMQNNPDSFPKMRFSDCVKKNMPKKPYSLESKDPHQDDPHQNSTSDNEEDDRNSEIDSSSDEEEQRIRSNPNYMSKVDYAIRLGYEESHLMTVLKKLGPEAEKNDVLLAELVKLFASTPRASEDPEFGSSPPPESALQNNKVSSPTPDDDDGNNLRMIVIDGSNVAMQHGNREVFSCKGIKYAVDYFKRRDHQKIVVFVPLWRKESPRKDAPITDQEILMELEKERILVFTPARTIKGRRVACYDDRYILKVAHELDGIVVSNDNYRDLLNENEGFRKVVEERLLMYSFMEDKFMPPDDPLGRHGPSLDNFLRKTPTAPEPLPPTCPYGKKCTYGNKCKYHHPERGNMPHKTVTEKLAERYKPMIQEVKDRALAEGEKIKSDKKSKTKATLARSKSISQKEDDSIEFLNATRDSKSSEYNEKLTKLVMNIKLSESSMSEKFCSTNNNNNNNNNNNISSPELSALSPHCPPTNLSNRYQPSSTEPLVIGHLQLAKKLSDDATKDAEKKSMGSNMTKNCLYTNNGQYSPTKPISPKPSLQNQQTLQQQHLKVSRQHSIYSEDDPRLNGNMSRSISFVPEHHYKPFRRMVHYHDSESYNQNQSSLLYGTTVMPTLPQMQSTAKKFLSYPQSYARQSSYPSTWMQVPIMDQYNQINVNLSPPQPTYHHSMSNNHEQIYPSGLYEPVHPNSCPVTPVSFSNTGTMPRASYMDPNQYPYSPTPLSPTSMNYLQMHQTPTHHIPQQNMTHSPTHHVSPPPSAIPPHQSGLPGRVQETEIYHKLCGLFQEEVVAEVLKQHPNETDPFVLCRYLFLHQNTKSTGIRSM